MTSLQIKRQVTTNLFGPMNITRAVLPVMRKARSGYIISISSLAGLIGAEYVSAYTASKFGLEGWMESLSYEVAPFGIKTTIFEPGLFRTGFLKPDTTTWHELSIDDYAERSAQSQVFREAQKGNQAGDPSKLAKALITIASQDESPFRFLAGAEQKVAKPQQQINAYRDLSTSLGGKDAETFKRKSTEIFRNQ